MVPNPIKMDDLGVPLFLETPIFPMVSVAATKNPKDQIRSGGLDLIRSLYVAPSEIAGLSSQPYC